MHEVCAGPVGQAACMGPLSILVVDDHKLFAEALQARLSREPDMSPVRLATSAAEALALAGASVPDVAVLDVVLASDDGVALAQRLVETYDRCRVVMMTEVNSPETAAQALRSGARAWLSKTVAIEELLRVIRGVTRDEVWIAPRLLGEVLPRLLGNDRPSVLDTLTVREREILQCAVDGLTRTAAAERLGVSANTVRTHTQNLFAKLGVHSTLEAVAAGLRHGLRSAQS